MRIVIVDTSVVVAGLLTSDEASPTARVLDAMLNGTVIFLLSPALLTEYRAVLIRPKIASRHGLRAEAIDQLLTEITANAVWYDPQQGASAHDSGDDHLWALLAFEPESVLITGDKTLLLNKGHMTKRVVLPADYVAQWQ